jgi:hypothetical protein
MSFAKSGFYFSSPLIKISIKSLKFYASALLSVLAQSALCVTIEVSVDENVLANATITDYADTSLSFVTNQEGRIQYIGGGSCASLSYVSEDNVIYRALRICGLKDSNVPVFKINLTKLVTLSGTVEVPQSCNCDLYFVNLDEDTSLGRGTRLLNSTKFEFNETLPAGRYRIKILAGGGSVAPEKYYIASVGVDARLQSVSNIKIASVPLGEASRFGASPPRADLISVRHSDGSHLSFVEGAPGAAEPLVSIGIVNLQTGQTESGVSEADGSFSIKFFAPSGSAIQIGQDRHADAYSDFTSNAPSTLIYVPQIDSDLAIATGQRLNGSSQNAMRGLRLKGGKDPGVAWLTGTLDTNEWQPGRAGELSGTVDIYSRNLDYGVVPQLENGDAYLELLFNEDGEQKTSGPENSSSDLTITELPIERSEPAYKESIRLGYLYFSDYTFVGDGHARASWTLNYEVPSDTPNGVYQLVLSGNLWSMNPWFSGLTSDRLFYEDVYGEPSFHLTNIHGAARINIGQTEPLRLYAAILMNEVTNGSRGTVAKSDSSKFGIASRWVYNAEKLILPPSTRADGSVHKYNIEPFVPLTAYSNKEWLNPPKIPLSFPTGQLIANVQSPSGSVVKIGPHTIKGGFAQKATTSIGEDLARNSNVPDSHYAVTTYSDEFNLVLDEYGEYKIELVGNVKDIYGEVYEISGNYSVYVAELLDIETGVFPGTPFEVGDSFSASLITQPGLPAEVSISLSHFPNSSVSERVTETYSGDANRFGYFASSVTPFKFTAAGEYLVNYDVSYTSPDGVLWMASRKWASIVETPNSSIVTHGHRGDEAGFETRQWYLLEDSSSGQNGHFFSPYQIGDVMWTKNFTSWNAAMQNIVTLEDGDGTLTALVGVGDRDLEGLGIGSMYLRSTTSKTYRGIPPFVDPTQLDIHWGYYYSSIGRPGVSVREFVGTGSSTNGYWRFNTPYGYQLGNGFEGDLPNDFKFIFGGAVYRVPGDNFSHYGAYGSLWAMLPETDTDGGRVMPPFQGASGGPSGGPLFTLNGEEIDIFLHPQGVRPGTILEEGDVFSFSGQVGPTLPSKVEVQITSPGGVVRTFDGTANKVGYFYNPNNDYVVTEAGVHSVEVSVIHDGETSAGRVESPYPSGSVLGASNGKFNFYVATKGAQQAEIASELPSKLSASASLELSLQSSDKSSPTSIQRTVTMPGFILSQSGSSDSAFKYDAYALNESFPNLDLPGGELQRRNGADTVTLSFLAQSVGDDGATIFEGRQVLLQGEKIFAPSHQKKIKGTFAVRLEDSDLRPGKRLKATVDLEAKGDADIYVAIVLPNGDFITFNKDLVISGINQIIPFAEFLALEELESLSIIDVPLDDSVASGDYRMVVITTAVGKSIYDQSYWLGFDEITFSFAN